MKEFQSQLEQLLPAEELFFDATPGFGRYKPFLFRLNSLKRNRGDKI